MSTEQPQTLEEQRAVFVRQLQGLEALTPGVIWISETDHGPVTPRHKANQIARLKAVIAEIDRVLAT